MGSAPVGQQYPLSGSLILPGTPNAGGPPFGSGAPVIKTRKFALDTAQTLGGALEIDVAGNFLWAFNGSDVLAEVDVQFNDQTNDPVAFTVGMGLGGIRFGKLYVSWAAQAGKTLTLMYGILPDITNFFINPAQAVNPVNVNASINVAVVKEQAIKTYGLVTITTGVGGNNTTTQVLAANPKRLYAMIQMINPQIGVAMDGITVGDANANGGGASGAALQGLVFGTVKGTAGTTIVLQTTAAIYVGASSNGAAAAGTASLQVFEVLDS